MCSAPTRDHEALTSWEVVERLPVSYALGTAGSHRSWYRLDAADAERLTFDLSNNRVLANLSRFGQVLRMMTVTGVEAVALKPTGLRGVTAAKQVRRAGPFAFPVRPGLAFHELRPVTAGYLGHVVPCFSASHDGAALRLLAFAPPGQTAVAQVLLAEGQAPRALLFPMDGPAREVPADLALQWFRSHQRQYEEPLGALEIPGEPFWQEMLPRLVEQCRQPAMYLPDGTLGGGFIGSNCLGGDLVSSEVWSRNIWMKDSFYQALPLAMFAPRLCADAILFFLKWAMPAQAFGRGLKRYPQADPVTHSLSLTLAPFVLAGAYERMTGDREFFAAHPEIVGAARERFARMLASRPDQSVHLFPSMYISDGDARGDYHTGSNLLAWFAAASMARIAGDESWRKLAECIRADLWKHCSDGRRFYEGGNADGTFVPGHDGEESDVGLMPFYGFCAADEPALLRHGQLALTPENPLYAPGVDGIWWHDEQWHPATFPAWTTALSGAADVAQLRRALDKIERLTDFDGALWWWPYKYGQTDPTAVQRGPVKCGWAAGVLLLRLVHDILGCQVNVPARQFRFRPRCPWEQFTWNNLRLGGAVFDVFYQGGTARITNRNPEPYTCVLELEGQARREFELAPGETR